MDFWRLKVTGIIPEAKDTITIFLERTDGTPMDYQSGQFLTFIFYIQGKELRRSYSFSSAPGIDKKVSITVKRVINGEISRYLFDHLRVGDELQVIPPAGRFILETSRTFFFIAAGSGMAPVFSLLKWALEKEPGSQILLISQQHDEDSFLFYNKIRELKEIYRERFKWVGLLSTPGMVLKPGAAGRMDGLYFGRLNNLFLQDLVDGFLAEINLLNNSRAENLLFYLCGPASFMRLAQFTLRLMGIADEQIKKEHFTVEFLPPPPQISDRTPKLITVHHSGQTLNFKAAFPSTILQAAIDHNISLPYSCRGGRCSSCAARLLKGKLSMSINEVLTDKDLKEGLVLTCVGYPETDVELTFSF